MQNEVKNEDHAKPLLTPVSAHALSRQELRLSLALPLIISIGVMALAAMVWLLRPQSFHTGLALAISLSLLLFLLYWTRREAWKQRSTAVLLALPALLGVGYGLSNGRVRPILLGAGLTILLLIVHRAVTVPLSYRFATRSFTSGDYAQALRLADKAIVARPSFWESYQLKALIFLAQLDFPRAERAAKEAMHANPQTDMATNTLGQIYLAQAAFAAAKVTYETAVRQNPDHALHWYHLGLCHYRLGAYAEAAESLVAASKRTPRLLEYELLTHYYLWRALKQVGRKDEATAVYEKMQKFAPGLPLLQAQLAHQPITAHLPLLQADLEDLAGVCNPGAGRGARAAVIEPQVRRKRR